MDNKKNINERLILKPYDEYYLVLTEGKNKYNPEIMERINNEEDDLTRLSLLSNYLKQNQRDVGILTFVDDEIYDILHKEFFDKEKRMIVSYDKLVNQINPRHLNYEYNVTKDDLTLKMDFDEFLKTAIIYSNMFDSQCDITDITEEFIKNEKPNTLKKQVN